METWGYIVLITIAFVLLHVLTYALVRINSFLEEVQEAMRCALKSGEKICPDCRERRRQVVKFGQRLEELEEDKGNQAYLANFALNLKEVRETREKKNEATK